MTPTEPNPQTLPLKEIIAGLEYYELLREQKRPMLPNLGLQLAASLREWANIIHTESLTDHLTD